MKRSRWSESYIHYEGKKPGPALARWLNEALPDKNFIENLLADAQVVSHRTGKYKSLRELNTARKQKKLPLDFWDVHSRLNDRLAAFTHAPQIDLHDLEDGDRLSWFLVTDKKPAESLSIPIRCVLQLIDRDAVSGVRKCAFDDCAKWYFAGRIDQEFCSALCRWKAFASTEKFKQKRREYAKKNYHLKKSGKVK
jgi:hypothetical protein